VKLSGFLVGFFSFFSKKPASRPASRSATRPSANTVQGKSAGKSATKSGGGPHTTSHARQAAQSTTRIIDAIEFEMSAEFVNSARMRTGTIQPRPLPDTERRPGRTCARLSSPPDIGPATAFLLSPDTVAKTIALSASEAAPAIDEAAIMYALGRVGVAEELLQSVVQNDGRSEGAQIAWKMLFDLYEITHRHDLFDELSIAYVNLFETSPPGWHEIAEKSAIPLHATEPEPVLAFIGKIDIGIGKMYNQIRLLPLQCKVVRLDFSQTTALEGRGCEVLLGLFKTLQKSGKNLHIAGAPVLLQGLRAILQRGMRDASQAPWLLLMETYRLLNMEQEFE
jgi:ABC-type transporter Mla MlaB component